MRVVTGEAKGRKLKGPKTIGTRPIIDRVKQALFNILSTRVEDARFLDLFAGTGSVGIEALSQGAASATFIELDHKMLALVRENLQITCLSDRAVTLHADAFKFLQAAQQSVGADLSRPSPIDRPKSSTFHTHSNALAPYDIIYVAPPQYQEMAARALRMLDGSPIVAETGLVIIQIHPKERAAVAAVSPAHLVLTDERRYGSTLLMFYETKEEQTLDDK